MSLLSSQLDLEDVGALLLGNSFLTADPMGPLLDQDKEDDLPLSFSFSSSFSGEGAAASPSLSFSTCTSSLSPSSSFNSPSHSHLSSTDSLPPSPPPSFLRNSKAVSEAVDHLLYPLTPWLDAHVGTVDYRDDAFSGMDWMAEKIDLSDFDLESLIGSCSSDDPPSSPEELLASLDSQMDLDLVDSIPTPSEPSSLDIPLVDLPPLPLPSLHLPEVDEVHIPVEVMQDQEVVVKSEPQSPAPLSPEPLSPAYTLELGSEVDVLEFKAADPPVATEPEDGLQAAAPVVLSLSGHIVVVLNPKDEPALPAALPPLTPSSCEDQSDDSDSGIDSVSSSPLRSPSLSPLIAGSSRTKPYSKPNPGAASPTVLGAKVKSVSGAPKVVEKKLKKMEQNKTAATRYRQKKKSEQDVLNAECSELETRNRELSEKAESISREIQYLKDLMEEVRSAKNRKKTTLVA